MPVERKAFNAANVHSGEETQYLPSTQGLMTVVKDCRIFCLLTLYTECIYLYPSTFASRSNSVPLTLRPRDFHVYLDEDGDAGEWPKPQLVTGTWTVEVLLGMQRLGNAFLHFCTLQMQDEIVHKHVNLSMSFHVPPSHTFVPTFCNKEPTC